MRNRISLLLLLTGFVFEIFAASDSGVVHEWGTFTSVAGADGSALSWRPLYGPSDLPCFVHRLDQRNLKVADYGTVRMETPVLYFYPARPMAVSVHVDFPNGRVTEWYPQASSVQPSSSRCGWIEWNHVELRKTEEPLPKLAAASHYYAARQTGSWSLESDGEKEKLLFYRGIADFGIDLRPVVNAGGVSLRNVGTDSIPTAILFENHPGKTAFRVTHGLRERVDIPFSSLNGSLDDLLEQFEAELIEMGLYHNEAHAMIETWRDSWFEEGLRVFYLLPRAKVEAVLPISIKPAAGQLARVFVGRIELLSPRMRTEIGAALANGDARVLKKYGRFLNAFLTEMGRSSGEPPMSDRARQFLVSSDRQIAAEPRQAPCPQ